MKTNTALENGHDRSLDTLDCTMRRAAKRAQMALLAGAVACLAASTARAQFNLPFYEPFPIASTSLPNYTNQGVFLGYGNGEELGNTATEVNGADSSLEVWTFGNSVSSSSIRVLSTGTAGLQYPGLTNIDAVYQTGMLSNYIKDTSSVKNRAVALNIPANQTNNPMTIYASVLVSIETNTYNPSAAPYPFFGLSTNNTGNTSVNPDGALILMTPSFNLMVSKNTTIPVTTVQTAPLTPFNTNLLVIAYKYHPGSNDEVDLWVNPTALGSNAVVPTPTLAVTNGANLASNYFGAVGVFEGPNYTDSSIPPLMFMDEIRVATNWGGVTPSTPAPGNSYSVTGGGSACGDTGFNVGLSGSDANVTYSLYTNGVPTGQSVAGSGSAVTFGPQTATALYTVTGSNTVTGNVGWMSGSATVSLLSAPTITSEPVPVIVSSGELAAFSVAAAGGGETYQWYRNGAALTNGAEFSGVQTPNLVIYPATSADAATLVNGYYVHINNSCGTSSVISTTNSLTIDTPANLEWYGDGVSNLWDVSMSLNWNTNTELFHYGDDVTFDDNAPSADTTVTLNSSYLSPSLITINGNNNSFVFTGSGALVGSGSIVMNNADTLTLETANTMSGGLIISNGTVIYNGQGTLGSGPINLAGGILEAANIGAITVTNQIIVTASNSAIASSSTGGQPVIFTNALLGTAGNLTFLNTANKNGQPTIELTAPFTFGLPVILNPGSGNFGVLVSGENTSGSQIWNNDITGSGELWRDAVGGTTILTDTNNYAGDSSGVNSQSQTIGTLLTDGALGVGADSTADGNGNPIGALGAADLVIDTRGTTPQLFAYGGPHVVSNYITFFTNVVGPALTITGTNELSLAGGIDMNETNRSIDLSNTAPTIVSGQITDDGYNCGVTMTGPGALYLDAANIYTGGTTNSGGLLAGTGSVSGTVVINSGSSLGGGDPTTIGAFTIMGGGSLILGGNLSIRVNKSLAVSNDSVTVTSPGTLTATGAGVVTVNNVGPALTVGNTFYLFNAPLVGGASMTVEGGGMNWSNHLAIDGGITATSVLVVTQPQITTVALSSGSLVFSGTNATTGSTYYVLSTTNLALPISAWTAISTNVFSSGAFSVTNPVGGALGYYILKESAP